MIVMMGSIERLYIVVKKCGYNALIKENMGRHVNGKRDNCSKYLNKVKSVYVYKYL
jgi:hypothetical protein